MIGIFKNTGLYLCYLMIVFSTKVHANWVGDIRVTAKGFQESLFSADDLARTELLFILEKLKIRGDLPESVLKELADARENPSRLFYSPGFRKEKKGKGINWESPNSDVSYLLKYQSAIDVLQSDVHRIVFFSLFDPSHSDQIGYLFGGLRVHRIPHTEIGFDEIVEIADFIRTNDMWDDWILFRGMAEQAILDGHLKVEIVDIEAAFISGFKEREIPLPSYHSTVVEDSFRTFTGQLVSGAEESGRLADFYKSPYCRLPLRSPYRERLLSALQKSDLSDRRLILKWWHDVYFLPGGMEAKGRRKILEPYIREAFDSAKKGRGGNASFNEEAFMRDPFISELLAAGRDDRNLHRETNEIISSLKGEKYEEPDVNTMTPIVY